MNRDLRGGLGVINLSEIPFLPKRFFWIFESPDGAMRAQHAHKKCEQFIVCQSGSVEINVVGDDLTTISKKLVPGGYYYLRKMHWLELSNFSSDCVLGVWASELYDRSEYIEDFDDFQKLVSKS